ncbi:MAG: GDP-L-fucose synthase [Deltaproteobacteria bacterium]|nr:GDP-L-fucose synthase [Deltaproteobacteria bacterium]
MALNSIKKLLITGGSGFLGTHVVREFERNCPSVEAISTFRSSQYDLREQAAVRALLNDIPCDTVIHLAARVGGIGANREHPGAFFYDNLMMGANLIEEARKNKVQKFILIGTVCSYPKFTPVPFRESDLWNGYPEETNAPYGIAKKALMVQLQAYRKEYAFNGISLLMVNLFGPGDNFDLNNSHVIPGMMRRFHEAKMAGANSVTLWGDGTPTREFLYVEEAARAVRLAAEQYNSQEPLNIGSGLELSMRSLAQAISKVVGFSGSIDWDVSKPNGQPRRLLDTSRSKEALNFEASNDLERGLRETYAWYLRRLGK